MCPLTLNIIIYGALCLPKALATYESTCQRFESTPDATIVTAARFEVSVGRMLKCLGAVLYGMKTMAADPKRLAACVKSEITEVRSEYKDFNYLLCFPSCVAALVTFALKGKEVPP
jgi:hypothetical protein